MLVSFLWIHDSKYRIASRMDITQARWFTSQVNPILQRPNGEELHCLNSKGKNFSLYSSPMPTVARMVSVIAMTCSLVGARTLMPVISVVVTLLLVLPRMVRALPGSAPGTRRTPAAWLPWFVCWVFVVFWFLVTSHLGTFVARTVVELSWRRVTAAPRTAVRLGTAWCGVTFTFPVLWGCRSGWWSWITLISTSTSTPAFSSFLNAVYRAIWTHSFCSLCFPFSILHCLNR